MKIRTMFGCFALLFFCQTLRAQEEKSLDVFLGYSYTRSYTSSASSLGGFNLSGGDVSVSYPFFHKITAVADFNVSGAARQNSDIVGIQLHGTLVTYLFGPRLILPHWRRITPFAEVLAGVAHGTSGLYNTTGSQIAFAWEAGGGLDYRLTNSLHLRPLQADYLQSRFSEGDNGRQFQNDLRVSTGLVVRF